MAKPLSYDRRLALAKLKLSEALHAVARHDFQRAAALSREAWRLLDGLAEPA